MPGQPFPHRNGAECHCNDRKCAEQHAHPRDERAIAAVRTNSRRHCEIRDVDCRISRSEQQVANKDRRDAPIAGSKRRQIGKDERQGEGNGAHCQHCAKAAPGRVPVDDHAGGEIGDTIPDRRDHEGCRRNRHRQVTGVGIIKQKEEHDALPKEVEGEVTESEQQESPFGRPDR